MNSEVTVRVAGRSGDGSGSTADILAKVVKRRGYYVFEHKDVHSNIEGLPTAFTVRITSMPRFGLPDKIDVLLCFDLDGLVHLSELNDGGLLVYDSSLRNPTSHGKGVVLSKEQKAFLAGRRITVHDANFADMAKEAFQFHKMRNTIALGALATILGIDAARFTNFIETEYGGKRRKGAEKLIEQNLKAFTLGYEVAVKGGWQASLKLTTGALGDPGRLFMFGNELIAFGALVGGCRGFVSYPITPASEIFEFMMKYMRKFGGVAVQADSEIAAISMVVGMAHAGLRAMAGTSGPGLSLMQEGESGSGMTETPIVLVNVQRGGPSTGLPTRSSQEDIQEVLYGGHGEFPRIVLAPATPEEGFLFGALALNLAEKFQCPVFILTEKEFGQSRYTVDPLPFDKVSIDRGKIFGPACEKEYRRYELTKDGLSPRVFPGTPDVTSMVSTNEHDEYGYVSEKIEMRRAMVKKRMQKEQTARQSSLLPEAIIEMHGSRFGIISIGSTYGPIEEARELIGSSSPDFLRLRTLWPFPVKAVRSFIKSRQRIFVVEQNFTGQLERLIQQEVTGPSRKLVPIRKYDGRPFKPQELVDVLRLHCCVPEEAKDDKR